MLKFKHLMTGTAMGVVVVAGVCSTPALAAGTAAGTEIVNEITVAYQVGGIDQEDEEASDEIIVDRKIDLIVSRVDDVATEVTPGEEFAAVAFVIENLSNATLDFDLDAVQEATNGDAGITGNPDDSFDVDPPLAFYLDDGATPGIYDGTNTLITYLDELDPDSPVTILVVTPLVPLSGLETDDLAAVILTAEARESGTAETLGAALVESASPTAGEDTVFADGEGDTDGEYDAMFSETDDFIVLTAAITATKTSITFSDPINGEINPYNIPGATIEYCITVTNASGGADAENIVISDTLPSEVEYDSDFGIFVGGADCDTPGTDPGSFADPVVSGTITNLPAGDSQTLIFRAVIE